VTRYELNTTTRSGSISILEFSSINRKKPDGSLDHIFGLAVDITERRKAELELSEKHLHLERLGLERLADLTKVNLTLQYVNDLTHRLLEVEQAALATSEHANKMKLQFLSMVSHELRTPLTSIKGYATTLLATDINWDAETEHHFITVIDEEADKLIELIEQLLDVSRLQTGTLFVQSEPCVFSQIIETARAQLQTVSAQHRLVINVSPGLPLILADVERIAGVLVNLVGNAAKFSPLGTPITVSAALHGNSLQINVSDEGPGIAANVRTKVFDIFWQSEQRTYQHTKGAGLGLAICKGIIRAHGGTIWVADVSPGTTMSFTLPLAVPNAGERYKNLDVDIE